jgi:hypothetical protein
MLHSSLAIFPMAFFLGSEHAEVFREPCKQVPFGFVSPLKGNLGTFCRLLQELIRLRLHVLHAHNVTHGNRRDLFTSELKAAYSVKDHIGCGPFAGNYRTAKR